MDWSKVASSRPKVTPHVPREEAGRGVSALCTCHLLLCSCLHPASHTRVNSHLADVNLYLGQFPGLQGCENPVACEPFLHQSHAY